MDRETAFLLYATFAGDVIRTAHAMDVSEAVVRTLADEGGWDKKLAPLIAMQKSSRPGDLERAINRALNFVQAHQCRMFMNRVLKKLTGLTPTELEDMLFPSGRAPRRAGTDSADKIEWKMMSTRALSDLAAAIERCHTMTYLALNDTATERRERGEDGADEDKAAGVLHAQLAKAMSEYGAKLPSPKETLAEAQIQLAHDLRATAQ